MRTGIRLSVLFLLALTSVMAQSILHIGPGANTGLKCPDGITDAALGCAIDPNTVPASHLDVFANSGGIPNLGSLYLIIGIPLASGAPLPSSVPNVTSVVAYNPYVPVQDQSPSTSNAIRTATGCAGNLNSGSSDAYVECGFGGANNSSSFVNWSGAVAGFGINPVQFALYYYNLSSVEDLGAKGLYDISFVSSLPTGTMEIAYGCATGTCSTQCYSTPFTEAGMVTPIPEPASLFLVGAAFAALAGFQLRKKR